jgi:hypothetical protein
MAIIAAFLFVTFSIFFDGLKILNYSLRFCCYILSPKALTVQSMISKNIKKSAYDNYVNQYIMAHFPASVKVYTVWRNRYRIEKLITRDD